MIEIKLGSLEDIFMSQVDPRRRQELSDARMIQEDHNAMANLSERPIHKQFNQNRFKHNCNKAASAENIFNDEVSGR